MAWKKVNNSDAGDATHFGGNDMDKISDLFGGVVDVDPVDMNTNFTFRSSKFRVRNPGNTMSYIFAGDAIAADRTITLPLLTGNDTLVTQAFGQPLSNKVIDADLNTITNIENADIKAGANIAKSKISTTAAWTAAEVPNLENLNGVLTAVKGGTGQSAFTVGDILYASSTTALSKRAIGTEGQYLRVTSGVPTWASAVASAIAASGSDTFRSYEPSKKITFSNVGFTPLASEIVITPKARSGGFDKYHITDISATGFTLHVHDMPGMQTMPDIVLKVDFYTWNPSDPVWEKFIQLKKRYPRVNLWVLCNWANGPDIGSGSTAARQTLINNMKAAGVVVGGYVYTDYGVGRTGASIDQDVLDWVNTFAPDFILFDEMEEGSDTTLVSFYQARYDYAKGLGVKCCIGNPGTNLTSELYATTMDAIIISEQGTLPGTSRFTSPSWKLKYPKFKWWLDWHTAYYYDSEAIEAYFPYVGAINVTDDTYVGGVGNPYETIPTNLDTQMAHLDRINRINVKVQEDLQFDWAVLKRV